MSTPEMPGHQTEERTQPASAAPQAGSADSSEAMTGTAPQPGGDTDARPDGPAGPDEELTVGDDVAAGSNDAATVEPPD